MFLRALTFSGVVTATVAVVCAAPSTVVRDACLVHVVAPIEAEAAHFEAVRATLDERLRWGKDPLPALLARMSRDELIAACMPRMAKALAACPPKSGGAPEVTCEAKQGEVARQRVTFELCTLKLPDGPDRHVCALGLAKLDGDANGVATLQRVVDRDVDLARAIKNVSDISTAAIAYAESEHASKDGSTTFYPMPPNIPWTPGRSCCVGGAPLCAPSQAFRTDAWNTLNFWVGEPHGFQYSVTTKGKPGRFTVQVVAVSEPACDGKKLYLMRETICRGPHSFEERPLYRGDTPPTAPVAPNERVIRSR